jgi:amino acid adenylation domain-containing protein
MPARELSVSAFEAALAQEWAHVERLGSLARDLGPRTPELRGRPLLPARWPVAIVEAATADGEPSSHPELDGSVALLFCVSPTDGQPSLCAAEGIAHERLAAIDAQLAALAHAAAHDPSQPVARLSLLDAAERERILVEWNGTERPIPHACVHELVQSQGQRTPEAPAVRFGDTVLSYAELTARAHRLAHALRDRGVREGDLVALCIRRSVELVVGLLAILEAGAAYVPIDPTLPRERMDLLVQRSRPTLALTDASTRAMMAELGPTLCVHTDAAFVAERPCTAPLPPSDPERLAYVIFTSGSTGEPKAVEIRHRSLVNHGLAVQDHYALGPGDRMLCSASIGFDVAAEQIYPALFQGAEVVVRPDDLLESFAGFDAFVRQRGLTAMILPTAFWHEWVRYLGSNRLEVPPSLRLLSVGTEKALAEVLAAWRRCGADGVRFIQGYGPTETTVTCTMFRHDPDAGPVDADRPLPIGRPLANNEIYILDAAGEPVPVGVPGELCVGGAGLARGYLGRPDLTAERFVPHPLRGDARIYKTGDIAYWQPDGQIVYVGRTDHQVKIRGFRVELGEIEAVLRSHPGVRESVVLLRDDPDEPRRLVAYLVTDPAFALEGLWARCRARLPEYMVPAAFVSLDAFPLSHNGKVDRGALPRPGAGERPRSRDAQDDVELILAGAFAEVLRVPAVGMTDGFFDLGGDSLAAMKLLARLETIFSLRIPLEQLLRTDTVEALGEHIRNSDRAGSVDGPSVVRLKGGEGTPVFLVLGMFMYQYLARALGAPNPVYSVYLPLEAELLSQGKLLPPVQELARLYVEVLRQHTPHGPYVLGGASFGGIVAYEMAQQLEALGEEVELVVLLDSMLPRGRQSGMRAWSSVIMRGLLEQRQWVLEKARRRLQRLRPRPAGEIATAPDPLQEERARLELAREQEYERCQQAYDPSMRPYGGDVVLYRSEAPKRPVMPFHGFEELVTGRLESHDVAGDHVSMLLHAEIGRLATDLQRRLEARAARRAARRTGTPASSTDADEHRPVAMAS